MTTNRRIFLNIVVTYGRLVRTLVIGLVCGWRTLMDSKTQTLPTPRLKQFPEGWGRWFDGGENGKIYGKGMDMSRQISRRFDRSMGERMRSACSIVSLGLLFWATPLKITL